MFVFSALTTTSFWFYVVIAGFGVVSGFVSPVNFLRENISSKDMPSQTTLMAPIIMIGSSPTMWLIRAVASSRFSGTPSAKKISPQ